MLPLKKFYYKVSVKAPFFKTLTYEFSSPLQKGLRVKIPLGRKKETQGLILDEDEKGFELQNLKPISKVLDFPPLSDKRISWLKWLGEYYHYPLGLIASLCYPPLLNKKSVLSSEGRKRSEPLLSLTEEQDQCVQEILKRFKF